MRRTESSSRVEPRLRGPEPLAGAGSAAVELRHLPRDALAALAAAGQEVIECHRVLAKSDDTVVGRILESQGTFYEWNHYPPGDVYDFDSGAQNYYHAHPKDERPGEHGHFHAFLRRRGMPPGLRPAALPGGEWGGDAGDALTHLIAISMSDQGRAIQLFTTNRWVTGETWYAAPDVIAMLERFVIDLTRPSWAVNRWITALVRFYRPEIEALLVERDRAVAAWQRRYPQGLVFDDRRLEITSKIDIAAEEQLGRVLAALRRARR
ncbi:MAG: DUF6969 family protein [Alphaproteobacteria bacterium]